MSEQPRRPRVQRERNGRGEGRGGGGGHQESRTRRDHANSSSRPPSSSYRSSGSSQHHSRNSSSHVRRVPSSEASCTHICSRRGIVLICATLTNILVLFCLVAAYMTLSGMSAMNFGSGSFVGAMIPFEGVELQQVRDLDMQFGQMRAPGVYGGVAFSLTFGVLSLLFVVSGNKPPHVLPWKLLIGQFVFQLVGAVIYVVAVGLYLHFVISVNSTDVCSKRERLYARNGYTWMNCNVGGADAAVALFGIITAILYAVGSFLTFRTIQNVKHFKTQCAHYETEIQEQPKRAPSAPLQSDLYV